MPVENSEKRREKNLLQLLIINVKLRFFFCISWWVIVFIKVLNGTREMTQGLKALDALLEDLNLVSGPTSGSSEPQNYLELQLQ